MGLAVIADPFVTGYSAIRALAKHLTGELTGAFISTERTINADNVDLDETQRLVEANVAE